MNAYRSICISTALMGLSLLLLTGCGTVSSHSHPYLTVPTYPPTDPPTVAILPAEPNEPHERLGEVTVDISGDPSKERIEDALRKKAAKLGAQAVFIVYDRTHVFPVVYVDWWGSTVTSDRQRDIVAVAIRYTTNAPRSPAPRARR